MKYSSVIEIVSKEFSVSPEMIFRDSLKRASTVPRCAAVLLFRDELKLSLHNIRRLFHKKSHTTILDAARTARNLIETDKNFRRIYAYCLFDLHKAIELQQLNKQRYNLNYRLRKKQVRVDGVNRQLILPPSECPKIQSDRQFKQLLSKHRYSVQYSLF